MLQAMHNCTVPAVAGLVQECVSSGSGWLVVSEPDPREGSGSETSWLVHGSC